MVYNDGEEEMLAAMLARQQQETEALFAHLADSPGLEAMLQQTRDPGLDEILQRLAQESEEIFAHLAPDPTVEEIFAKMEKETAVFFANLLPEDTGIVPKSLSEDTEGDIGIY